jgi:hypothetical protein
MALTQDALGTRRIKKGELSLSQRSAIIYSYQSGTTQSKLALDFRCTRKTIYNTIKRFQQHQSLNSRPRTGRLRVFSNRTRYLIYILARRHPFWTYKELSAAIPSHPSRSSIINILRPTGLIKYRTKRKIPIGRYLAR